MRAALQSIVLVVALVTCGSGAARAEPSDREQANTLFKAGLMMYEKGDYRGALALYRRANNLFQSPQIEFNMALTREKMGQPARAAVHYERFLRKADQMAYPLKVKAVKAKLAALRKKLATVTVTYATRGAAVGVDGEPVGKTPLGHRIYRRPGEFRLTVRKDGYRLFQKSLRLKAGGHEEVKVTLEPMGRDTHRAAPHVSAAAPVVAPAPHKTAPAPALVAGKNGQDRQQVTSSRPFYRRWWFWTAVGVVAAGVTVGVVASQTGGDDRVPGGELTGFSFR